MMGKECRNASRDVRRARGPRIGHPKSLNEAKVEFAKRMHANGESACTISSMLGVSRATVYRVFSVCD
jgi:DNA invertase Pin-like site-specific DNA recombinase